MTTETPAAVVEQDHLRDQLTGRADFLRDKGEQKTPILLYQAADEITRLRAENAELQRKLDEAVNMLVRWQSWSCGQRGGSPFFDTRDLLTSIRGEA